MKYNESFRARQSLKVDEFPIINGVPFEEVIRKFFSPYGYGYAQRKSFSFTVKDKYIGLCKEIYTAKFCSKGLFFQKNMIIPENKNICPLIRNCFYRVNGYLNGFCSYGFDKKPYKNGYENFPYEEEFEFIDEKFPVFKVNCISLDSIEHLTSLDPSLKYCAWNDSIDVIYYLRLYRKYPQVCEMLIKFGLPRLIEEKALLTIGSNKSLAVWIARNKDNLGGMAFRTVYNAYKKNPNCNPADYQKSLLYRIQAGKKASFSNKIVYSKALKFTTQEKIYAYLKEKDINSESYGDYLTACDWLKLDFSDTKVLFPHNFREMHDLYTAQYYEYVKDEEKLQAIKEANNTRKGMLETAEKFSFLASYSTENFCVVLAKSKEDLIDEGSNLSHCVGKMDYDKRMACGNSVIVFIRKCSEIDKSFVTAEVKVCENSLILAQCYGYKDSVPSEDVLDFAKEWLNRANKEYRKIA